MVAGHCPEELRPRPPPPPPHTDPSAPPPPPRNGGWCLHDFALHKQLGVGATSVVFQGAHSRTGRCLALKLYFKAQMSALNRHQVQRETEIHSRLDHPNIITMVRPPPPPPPSPLRYSLTTPPQKCRPPALLANSVCAMGRQVHNRRPCIQFRACVIRCGPQADLKPGSSSGGRGDGCPAAKMDWDRRPPRPSPRGHACYLCCHSTAAPPLLCP